MARPSSRIWGRLGAALAGLALLLLALLPPGAMPARIGDSFSVVICTGDGPMTLAVDADGQPLTSPPGRPAPCPFAVLTAAAALPAPIVLPAPGLVLHPFEPAQMPPLALRLAAVLAPSARAPPAIL